MLTELVVRNLGVIDELSLLLGPGMTAVTGETGAGKTLVVEAIDLLIGGRADASLVRPSASEAEIEGRFLIPPANDEPSGSSAPAAGSPDSVSGDSVSGDPSSGSDRDGGKELIVRRVIPRSGRSRAYIDGRLATVAALGEIGTQLVDLHGQHDHQSLLRGPVQRSALDRFGRIDTSLLADLSIDLRRIDAVLAQLGGDARTRAREIDLLQHQCHEIESAGIADPDEDQRLDEAESLLAGAVANRAAAYCAVGFLDADGMVADGIGQALALLRGRAPFDDLIERLEASAAELTDIANEVRDVGQAIEDNPAALAELRERRQLLSELRRKYGSTLAEVLDFSTRLADRLAELAGHEGRVATAEAERSQLLARLESETGRVRLARSQAAPRLALEVAGHLSDLALAGARLSVDVSGSAGEDVIFKLAANVGHDPLPLRRVASGGELARTMLALRMVLTAGPDTLVFDEVDAGIGGASAHSVGRSLAVLARDHQVLVVTHLAQVAAHADHHVAVRKSELDGSTFAVLSTLDSEQRVTELSRMLSGSPRSASARDHARELLVTAGSRGEGTM